MKPSMTYQHALTAAFLFVSTHGVAQADTVLAKARNCIACHSVDAKVVGPGFRSIADRYAGQKGAEEMLAQKIRAGGVGKWGSIPMPANLQVSESEALTLSKWVISLK
jgi:cytochrome c